MQYDHIKEQRSFRPWRETKAPQKILIIRFYAIGDIAITFPACASLHEKYPETQIDYLTVHSNEELPEGVMIFNQIFGMHFSNLAVKKLIETLQWGLKIRRHKYDVIIDLQRNRISRLIRRIAGPSSWGEFDRFSPNPAGVRVLETFKRIGFAELELNFKIPVTVHLLNQGKNLLIKNGWNGSEKLIILNPAGLFETRNWPIQNYIQLSKLIQASGPVKFLFLGTDRIREKADYLIRTVGMNAINLVNQTSLGMALAIMQMVSAVISEDSGLMHIAWVSGVPTVGLFGSSRHDWSSPIGSHSRCLHSGDLPCGACMAAKCKYSDTHCLSRYTPEMVFKKYEELQKLFNR
ncbi:glycosyltransferase family 9 protein [bacterium]|nr:glycosyltransferase family 9 protein [bacterium]